jgi:hypothetical protein
MPTFPASKRRIAALALASALGLLLAACGGGGPSVANLGRSGKTTPASSKPASDGAGPSTSTGAGSSAASSTMVLGGGPAKALKFSECMRAHGVPNFPDPSADGAISISASSGINPQSQQVQSAQEICDKLLSLGRRAHSPAAQAQALANALKFSQCMRSHGVTGFPDPQSSGDGVRISLKVSASGGLDPRSPLFQAAQKACGSALPPLPGGGPTKAS